MSGLPAQLRRGDDQGHRRGRRRGRLAGARRRRGRRQRPRGRRARARSTTRAEALRVAPTFLQYYRENADYKERTYDFVPRVGLEAIRAAVLDEATGGPAALRERFGLARAAARDPWDDAVRGAQGTGDFHDLGTDPEPALIGPPPDALDPPTEDAP